MFFRSFLTVALSFLLTLPVLAENAVLVIAPTRLVIKPGQRTAEAAVTNTSDKAVRYKIELVNQVMTASGTTQLVEDFPYSAKPLIRYMPRVVELQPGKRQTIRMMVTRPQNLADGDYHTHMLFKEITNKVSATTVSTEDKTGLSIQVGLSYSMAIPLVVQQGTVSSSVTLENATFTRNENGQVEAIQATFQRHGNAEGMVRLEGTSGGKNAIAVRNVRLYREADRVTLLFPLTEEAKAAQPQEVTLNLFAGESKKAPQIGTFTVR